MLTATSPLPTSSLTPVKTKILVQSSPSAASSACSNIVHIRMKETRFVEEDIHFLDQTSITLSESSCHDQSLFDEGHLSTASPTQRVDITNQTTTLMRKALAKLYRKTTKMDLTNTKKVNTHAFTQLTYIPLRKDELGFPLTLISLDQIKHSSLRLSQRVAQGLPVCDDYKGAGVHYSTWNQIARLSQELSNIIKDPNAYTLKDLTQPHTCHPKYIFSRLSQMKQCTQLCRLKPLFEYRLQLIEKDMKHLINSSEQQLKLIEKASFCSLRYKPSLRTMKIIKKAKQQCQKASYQRKTLQTKVSIPIRQKEVAGQRWLFPSEIQELQQTFCIHNSQAKPQGIDYSKTKFIFKITRPCLNHQSKAVSYKDFEEASTPFHIVRFLKSIRTARNQIKANRKIIKCNRELLQTMEVDGLLDLFSTITIKHDKHLQNIKSLTLSYVFKACFPTMKAQQVDLKLLQNPLTPNDWLNEKDCLVQLKDLSDIKLKHPIDYYQSRGDQILIEVITIQKMLSKILSHLKTFSNSSFTTQLSVDYIIQSCTSELLNSLRKTARIYQDIPNNHYLKRNYQKKLLQWYLESKRVSKIDALTRLSVERKHIYSILESFESIQVYKNVTVCYRRNIGRFVFDEETQRMMSQVKVCLIPWLQNNYNEQLNQRIIIAWNNRSDYEIIDI